MQSARSLLICGVMVLGMALPLWGAEGVATNAPVMIGAGDTVGQEKETKPVTPSRVDPDSPVRNGTMRETETGQTNPDAENQTLGSATSQNADENKQLGPANDDADNVGGEGGHWLLQTLMALGIVLGLIFVLRALLKRVSGQVGGRQMGGLVEVLARTGVGPKSQVVFLRIGKKVIVVGQTPGGMNTLTTLDDDEMAWLMSQISSRKSGSASGGFGVLLSRLDRMYQGEKVENDEGEDVEEQYVDRTRDEVKGLLNRIRHLRGKTS